MQLYHIRPKDSRETFDPGLIDSSYVCTHLCKYLGTDYSGLLSPQFMFRQPGMINCTCALIQLTVPSHNLSGYSGWFTHVDQGSIIAGTRQPHIGESYF